MTSKVNTVFAPPWGLYIVIKEKLEKSSSLKLLDTELCNLILRHPLVDLYITYTLKKDNANICQLKAHVAGTYALCPMATCLIRYFPGVILIFNLGGAFSKEMCKKTVSIFSETRMP